MSASRRVFVSLSWLPVALLVWLTWQARQAEGWGAMAFAAAVLPPLLVLSTSMGVVGALLWNAERRRRRADRVTLAATVLAAAPVLWFVLRVLWRELV